MGCNCGGGGSRIAYEVSFRNGAKDGSKETFESQTDATAAIRANGGGTFRAVSKVRA